VTTRLVLVRHGETDAAVTGRTQGRIDNPLNARGIEQSRALVPRLLRECPTRIYSSPAARAVATAAPLASALGLDVELDPRLLEMDYGALDDLTGAELRERHPEFMQAWAHSDPADLRMPGGETLREVQARLLAAVVDIEAGHPEGGVVLCSHGFAIRTLLCAVLGVPLGSFRLMRVDLASVSVVESRDGGRVLLQLNEVCHLAPEAV
jgi:broad specificity phosphatase PhoE